MTWLLALGWPVALLFGWRWYRVNRQAWAAVEQAQQAIDAADFWKSLAASRAYRLETLEADAITWRAMALAPMQPDSFHGRVQ